MQAVIQKLELKKILNRHYIKIELIDELGIKRNIDNPLLSDNINFRRLVFGILSACGNYDLMRIATENPEPQKMSGYYQNGLIILENEKGEWLSLDRKIGLYRCQQPTPETRKNFELIIENNMLDLSKDEGIIDRIVSESGVFLLRFIGKSSATHFITGQIYYGLGYPITIGKNADPSNIAISAKMFTTFITSLMKLYGINDLLQFGGNTDNLPIVEIELNNNNKISTITNPTTGMGLAIGKKYEIINIHELRKQKEEKENLKVKKLQVPPTSEE